MWHVVIVGADSIAIIVPSFDTRDHARDEVKKFLKGDKFLFMNGGGTWYLHEEDCIRVVPLHRIHRILIVPDPVPIPYSHLVEATLE